jgi:hypothetical protein
MEESNAETSNMKAVIKVASQGKKIIIIIPDQ